MTRTTERIAVTGWGAVTPLGTDVAGTWNATVAGRSGISAIHDPWASDLPARIGGRITADIGAGLEPLQRRRLDRCSQLGLLAARQAWEQARPHLAGVESARVAVVIGTGIGGLATLERQHCNLLEAGPARVNPLTVPMLIPNAAAGQIAIDLGLHGGAHTPVSACASGAEALLLAQMLLNDDRADVVLAGGAEAPVNRLGLVGFAAMRALSCRNEQPDQASRPYGVDRDGFVLSEGAGVLVLQRSRDLRSEGPAPLGWLLACGSSSDGHHIVAPEPEGMQASAAMADALRRADIAVDALSFVQAHATGTPLGDLAEAKALARTLGARRLDLPVTAPKGQLGHLLGAAGAVETILVLQALRFGLVPRSANAEPLDPGIDLAVVQNGNLALTGGPGAGERYALKNAFGFGGHNISLVLAA
ncbi:MAG: beta-ketoacyl-[acyl-carrier-protein] synthase family protein [Cyanobium sp. Prado107]|jgi:3-oxoacyl-[acyl-carrier-protein] synthase II|nr:beta-ketoacyl-[acyl-carrier-protein] synthase family protein [Cyanobium sp. Prado107]